MSDVAKNEVAKKVVYGELVKKVSAIQTTDVDYDIKIVKTEKNHDQNKKYITTKEFKQLREENFAARLKQANLATEADIDDFVEMSDFEDKIKSAISKLVQIKENI